MRPWRVGLVGLVGFLPVTRGNDLKLILPANEADQTHQTHQTHCVVVW